MLVTHSDSIKKSENISGTCFIVSLRQVNASERRSYLALGLYVACCDVEFKFCARVDPNQTLKGFQFAGVLAFVCFGWYWVKHNTVNPTGTWYIGFN